MEDVERNGGVWRMLEGMKECAGCWKKRWSVEDVGRNGIVWKRLEEMENCG